MRAEEQLKQSMQQMHLSTEAKNRILSDVLDKASKPKAKKRPFYCSAVFKSLSAAAAVILVLILIIKVSSVMKDEGLGMKGRKAEDAAETLPMTTDTSEQAVYVMPLKKKNTEDAVNSSRDPDVSLFIPDPGVIASLSHDKKGDKAELNSEDKSAQSYYYKVKEPLDGEGKEDSEITLLYICAALEEYLSARFAPGKCYILSVTRTNDCYEAEVRIVEDEGEVVRSFVGLDEVPENGTDFIVTLWREEGKYTFQVSDISLKH